MAEDGHDVDQSPYQTELKLELNKLHTEDYVHAARLLNEEVKRVGAGEKYRVVPTIELHHGKPSSNAVKVTIPIKQYPNYNFVGKLLGPKGNTLKQLQQDTLCKLSILGRGSMRDKNKEEELRKEGGKYAHLNEELHIMIECFAESVESYNRLAHAINEIKKFMVPTMEDMEGRQVPIEGPEGGYFNGDGMGRGGGRMPPGANRGAPGGRGGLLSTPGGLGGPPPRGGMAGRGAPSQRGGPPPPLRGVAPPRGAPPQRGMPPSRGAPRGGGAGGPPIRGAPAQRGAPSQRGLPPPQRGAPPTMSRGGGSIRGSAPPQQRGAPPQRGMLSGRGAQSRGRMPPPLPVSHQSSVQDPYDDYGHGLDTMAGHGGNDYNEPELAYAQDNRYDDGYGRRDPYADEPAYEEPILGGGDTQYFDYGHGAGAQDYHQQEYESSRSSGGYDRGVMKPAAPIPGRSMRGNYRAHPYDAGRPIAQGRQGGY